MQYDFWRAAVLSAWVAAPLAALANQYEIVDLGSESTVVPVDLNDKGTVLGNTQARPTRGTVYRQGRWRKLAPVSYMYAINDKGDVAGVQYKTAQLTLWPRGQSPILIDTPTGTQGRLSAVNDDRTVTGSYAMANGMGACFLWTPDQGAVDMGWPGNGGCRPYAMNQSGEVTGMADNVAFLFRDNRFTTLGFLDGAMSTTGQDVNRDGHVVGFAHYNDSRDDHAFLWDGERMVDLNPKGYSSSMAFSINDHGKVVGHANDAHGDRYAVRFEKRRAVRLADEVTNLGAWKLFEAYKINNHGVILGMGELDGTSHSFLLVPTP